MASQILRTLRFQRKYVDLIEECKKLLVYVPRNPKIYEELCIGYYHVGEMEKSYECLDKIFSMRPRCPAILNRSVTNKLLFVDRGYGKLISPTNGGGDVVTVTITTCKRLNLFIQTVESFLERCKDLHLVKEFVCIDDNSSEEDRETMKTKFPFFRYIFKTPEQKGHAVSMKMLSGEVTTDYVLHLEDDWLFFNTFSLSEMLEIITDRADVMQCAVNKNYATGPNKSILGGEECWTEGNLRYFVHEFCPSDADKVKFTKKHGFGKSCNYWPHFTLQPSLIDTRVWKSLEFLSVPHFEMNYAKRYADRGWKTAFLQESITKHIGKNMGDTEGYNAYELNGVKQF